MYNIAYVTLNGKNFACGVGRSYKNKIRYEIFFTEIIFSKNNFLSIF